MTTPPAPPAQNPSHALCLVNIRKWVDRGIGLTLDRPISFNHCRSVPDGLAGEVAAEVWLRVQEVVAEAANTHATLQAQLAAAEADRKSAEATAEEAEAQVETASSFIRVICEAVGLEQPPLDYVISLRKLEWQVIGLIEDQKTQLETVHTQLAELQAELSSECLEVVGAIARKEAAMRDEAAQRERADKAEAQLAERSSQRDEMRRFAEHKSTCAVWPFGGNHPRKSTMMRAVACTCGLDTLLASVEGAVTP